ncbi:cupin domain-containing protein [Oscillospiraceae bacterium OttesenSCG-928-G22]|nr:cupin domain-containing protein [Oscillospiraceae bacterium OttesenSCG-928-G22]
MIFQNDALKRETKQDVARGDKGPVNFEHFFPSDLSGGAGRLFSKVTLEKGSSIGYHVHEGEYELYHILSGEGRYDDNGTDVTLRAGDTAFCPSGEGHSIECAGDGPLVFLALVLFPRGE